MPFLRDPRTFGKDDGASTGGDGGGGNDNNAAATPAPKTIGSVSPTGQYAGDGFEFVDSGSGYYTRTYTGANKNAGLGTDVIAGGTADNDVKAAIATISLNEGSEFAGSVGSATDRSIFGGGSESFAAQSGVEDYTPTITYGGGDETPAAPAVQAKTFSEAFAENRAAGNDVFTYNGKLYTTELAPAATPTPAAPTVSYDAFGDAYETPEAAADADRTMAQQATAANAAVAAAQDAAKERELFDLPVVSQSAQDYLDSLGTDWNYGGDATITDQEPSFTYTPQINTSAKDADLGVGKSAVTVTADDLLNAAATEGTADATTSRLPSSGGGGVTLANDLANTRYDALLDEIGQTGDVEGSVNTLLGIQPGSEFNPIQLDEIVVPSTFSGNIYGADSPYRDALRQQVQQAAPTTTVDTMFPFGRNTATSPTGGLFASGIGQATKLTGSLIESLGEGLSPTTARIGYDVGEVDRRLAEAAGATPGATAVKTGAEPSGLSTFGRDMMEAGGRLESRAEGGLPQDVKEDLTSDIVSPYISKLGRPGLQLDPGALYAQTIKSIPSTLEGFSGAVFGLPGLAATGAGMTAGEVGYEAGAEVKDEALRRGFSEDEADAMRIEAQKTGALYGVPIGAVSNVLFGRVVPGAGKSVIAQTAKNIGEEAFSEGYIEQNVAALASDPLLGQSTAGTRFSPNEAIIGGLTGGVATPVLSTALQPAQTGQYVPPAQTTGQVAQAPAGVATAYEQAAESMAEAGVSGVGDVTPDNVTLAEQLMNKQLEDEGAIDVTELDGLGLTLNEVNDIAERVITNKMDSDNQMLQALADESVLNTGGIDAELVAEINDKLGPEAGAQVVDNAVNRPFVSNEGKTRMDIMLENAAKSGASSMEAMAAEKVIEDQVASTGTVDPKVIENLKDTTGLTSEEINTMVERAGATLPESRLTLTDAKSVVSTPDLSGVESRITFQPTAADQAVTSKMDADAAAPLQTAAADAAKTIQDVYAAPKGILANIKDVFTGETEEQQKARSAEFMKTFEDQTTDLANRFNITQDEAHNLIMEAMDNADAAATTDQTARVMEVLQNARTQQVAGSPQLVSKTGIQSLVDAGLISEEAALVPGIAQAEVTELLKLGPDEVKSRMGSNVAAEVEVAETTETPVFTTVRNGDSTITPVFESVRTGEPAQDSNVAAEIEIADDTTGDVEVPVDDSVEVPTDVPVQVVPNVPVDTSPDFDEEEVEVILEPEQPEPEPPTGPDTDTDTPTIYIPPTTTTDEDGNTITECPEGYVMVQTADGPMCQKTTSASRQRAGRGVQAYTGIVTKPGARGPGQKRKTTTTTERVRPTTRSA